MIAGAEPAGPTASQVEAAGPASGRAAVDALPVGSALLVVYRGPTAGARFLLKDDSTTAGRHPTSEIFLDDASVSRRHAEFVRRGEGFTVRDIGSLNGTYVGRERVAEAALREGDEVWIGKFRMVFHVGTHAPPPEPRP
jgi:pSer/pThr/pTyr-binding forkhead associated (FHA) protein